MNIQFEETDTKALPIDLALARTFGHLNTCAEWAHTAVVNCQLNQGKFARQAKPGSDEDDSISTSRLYYGHQIAVALSRDLAGGLIDRVYEYAQLSYASLENMANKHGPEDFETEDQLNRFKNNFVAAVYKLQDVLVLLDKLYEKKILRRPYNKDLFVELPSANQGQYYNSETETWEPGISRKFEFLKEWLNGVPRYAQIGISKYDNDLTAAVYVHLLAAYASGDESVVIHADEYGSQVDLLSQVLDQEQWQYEQDGIVFTVTVPKLKTD